MSNPFRYFNSSPEVIRLVVMMYVRYPLSLRNVEDLLAERGIDISHETVRFWWNRFGPMFAAEIRKKRAAHMRGYVQWPTSSAASRNAATGGCGPCCTRPPTSC
jgi:putative transposase